MIANQLVPLLANVDMAVLMQMLQIANPSLAAALSSAYFLQSAVSADVQQVATALAQLMMAPDAPVASQNHTPICISSSSETDVTQRPTEAMRCSSSASCDSLQSSAYSEASQLDANTSAQLDPWQAKPCPSSPGRNVFDAFDTQRPLSTASSTVAESLLDDQSVASTSGVSSEPLAYNCHLCAFRSSHRTRFAEHMSSEFCAANASTMASRSSDTAPTLRKRCSHCAFSTYVSYEFDQHIRTHAASSGVYSCTCCGYNGASLGALRLHFKRRHPTESFFFHFPSLSRQKRHNDRSDTPQSVNLDPVVKLFRLDCSDSSKLNSR